MDIVFFIVIGLILLILVGFIFSDHDTIIEYRIRLSDMKGTAQKAINVGNMISNKYDELEVKYNELVVSYNSLLAQKFLRETKLNKKNNAKK